MQSDSNILASPEVDQSNLLVVMYKILCPQPASIFLFGTPHCTAKLLTKNFKPHGAALQIIYLNRKILDIFSFFLKRCLAIGISNLIAIGIILLYHWKHFKHITLLGIPASSLNSVMSL